MVAFCPGTSSPSETFKDREIGGKLTKLFLASLALVSAFAIAQSTLVGTFHGSSNNKAPKGYSDRVGASETLSATSETKSLFLLGSGLMGFASAALLLKAARQPAAS
jgi:hypothetical protein